MGVVTWMVETTEGYLDGAAETTFGNVASQLGGIIAVGSTLAVIGLLVNMALQVRSVDGRTAFWFAVKLLLITLFALNWVQFNSIASAITNGLDQLAGGMVAGLGGGGAGSAYFAAAFDDLIEEFGNYLNAAGDNMHWMAGAIIGAIGAFLLGVIGALCGLVLIFAKIMLAVMIGIAPIMIALSLFDVTKDYFLRWLSSTVSYALYPLVIAGVFSTVVGMSQSLLAEPDLALVRQETQLVENVLAVGVVRGRQECGHGVPRGVRRSRVVLLLAGLFFSLTQPAGRSCRRRRPQHKSPMRFPPTSAWPSPGFSRISCFCEAAPQHVTISLISLMPAPL
jgi:hypothetical protein